MKNAGVDVISVCVITSFNLSQDFLAFIYTETMDFAVHAIATFGWSSMASGVCVLSHIPARWVNQATFINTQHTLFEFIPFPFLQVNFSVISLFSFSKNIFLFQHFNVTTYRGSAMGFSNLIFKPDFQKNQVASALSTAGAPHLLLLVLYMTSINKTKKSKS